MTKVRELVDEFRNVVLGRSNLLDTILPPIVFIIVHRFAGPEWAGLGAASLAALVALGRVLRRQSPLYALGGLAGAALAFAVSRWLGRAEGFFLPNMLGGGLTILACAGSLIAGRPLVAWTSYLARRWPLEWYWHPQVRPAYSEVTLAWTLYFGLRLLIQLGLFLNEEADLVALGNLLTGWPATILLLALSYLFGTWRLARLRGPSVEEFLNRAEPPWEGQPRGF